MSDPSWRTRAACRGMDTDLFYDDTDDGATRAKAVCADCPVWRECLTTAMDNREDYGVWGGRVFGKNERRRLRAAERRAEMLEVDHPHGSRTRYQRGCRCDPCTIANRMYMRRQRGVVA